MLKEFLAGNHRPSQFDAALHKMCNHVEVKSILILTGAETKVNPKLYDHILQGCPLPVVGGIFPEIVYQGKRYKKGSLIVGMTHTLETIWMHDDCRSPEQMLEERYASMNLSDKTVFVFADAFYTYKTECIEALYNTFGGIPSYIGGGAGSLSFTSFPCIYTNEGVKSNGIIVGISDQKSNLGVAHGWKAISAPMKVTECTKNVIHSLNWRPAVEVYQEIVEAHSGQKFDFDNFFEASKSYPFGISKLDAEMVVRDPFSYDGTDIHLIDEIDKGSHVQILYGDTESLLSGSKNAHDIAVSKVDGDQLFIIDCISRVLFLGDDFDQEIENIDPDGLGFGALTLGEIANNGDAFLEIYNKTAVVCALDE